MPDHAPVGRAKTDHAQTGGGIISDHAPEWGGAVSTHTRWVGEFSPCHVGGDISNHAPRQAGI